PGHHHVEARRQDRERGGAERSAARRRDHDDHQERHHHPRAGGRDPDLRPQHPGRQSDEPDAGGSGGRRRPRGEGRRGRWRRRRRGRSAAEAERETTERAGPQAQEETVVITAQEVREAAEGLRGIAVRTPLRYVAELDAWLKLENLQPVGAFKIRGAYNAVRRLPAAARAKGVITYSSGNHGQALAFAGKQFGVRSVVVMPETAPPVKVAGVKRWGGEVVFAGRTSDDRH